MRLPWSKKSGNLIPAPNASNVIYTQPFPQEAPPSFREALRGLYEKHDGRITSVEAYKTLGRPNGISWMDFHQEWTDMKKEGGSHGWLFR